MPLQNRVTPDGRIIADAGRGTLMGNRGGQLHDEHRRLTGRRWASKQWIACTLNYKDRRETIMAPGRYTQLFFLDEATALAAGHRPCALCRRGDFLRFMELWRQLRGLAGRPRVAEVDAALHAERVGNQGVKVTYDARLGDMPEGVMISAPGRERSAQLYFEGKLLPWSPSGYGAPESAPPDVPVRILTPPSIVAVIAAGYAPMLHASARPMSVARST